MRELRLTPEAKVALTSQVDYLVSEGAPRAAETLLGRVEVFLSTTLLEWPQTGRYIPEPGIWETWIPRTRLVAWYVFDDEELVVVAIWHASQDRQRR
ncbi:MAG: type II toxin-antitoxin system RelE/ParE family toxin [Hyphomicrobiaceae bacterium]